MEHHSVNVPNMGTFVLKKQRVEKKIEKYNAFLEKIDASESMSMYETTVDVKADVEKYQNALEIMNTEAQRRKQVEKLKEKYLDNVE